MENNFKYTLDNKRYHTLNYENKIKYGKSPENGYQNRGRFTIT